MYLQVPFFEQAGPAFIRDVATIAVMYFFPRGEIIQYSDTITRELFCIYRGTCQVRSPIQLHEHMDASSVMQTYDILKCLHKNKCY